MVPTYPSDDQEEESDKPASNSKLAGRSCVGMSFPIDEIADQLSYEAGDLPRMDYREKLAEALKLAAQSGFDYGWDSGVKQGKNEGYIQGRSDVTSAMKDHYFRPISDDEGKSEEIKELNVSMGKLRSDPNKANFDSVTAVLLQNHESRESGFMGRMWWTRSRLRRFVYAVKSWLWNSHHVPALYVVGFIFVVYLFGRTLQYIIEGK